MWKKFAATSIIICTSMSAIAQLQKFYTVKPGNDYNTLKFEMNATSGGCYIKKSDSDQPVEIFGNPDFDHINPSFEDFSLQGKVKHVMLKLEDYQNAGLARTISYNMFDTKKKERNFWKIYFNDSKTYDLDLRYGVGDAHLNLSGIPVKRFKMNTGSADVVVNYDDGFANPISMDTFFVKVDMGKLTAHNLERANAKYVMANIGFGNTILDFSEHPKETTTINASVGAGKLTIYIPAENAPTIIHVIDSPMCNLKMTRDFRELSKNVYVNSSYTEGAPNLRTFYIDVALGSVVFAHK